MKEPDPACNLGDRVLKALDMAVLRRTAPGLYRLSGLAPDFYTALFPPAADGAPCESPWELSPMLDFFLGEAESFFAEGAHGVKHSGFWLEGDQEVPLMATALQADGTNVIIIHAAREYYLERTRILRQARTELLKQQKMVTDLDQYKKKALYDPLTKVYSRWVSSDILKEQMTAHNASDRRAHSPEMAVLMLDIDHFKNVNDEFGHLTGDAVLIQLGEILFDSLRANDTPVRYGGEEFLIIAPGTNLEQSIALAEKLRQAVAEHNFGLDRPVTISIGCTIKRSGDTPEEFVRRADQALYEAKNTGRNRVCGLL